jgi:hypothetical protein
MEDDMPTTPMIASGYLDDSTRPFMVFLEENDFVRVLSAKRLGVGNFELSFYRTGTSLSAEGLRMFVTSVGIGGTTTDNASVFVRQITYHAPKPPGFVTFKISTVRNYIPYAGMSPIDPSEPANTSFHFLLVHFGPSNLLPTQGIG